MNTQITVGSKVIAINAVPAKKLTVIKIEGEKIIAKNKYGITGTFTASELKLA